MKDGSMAIDCTEVFVYVGDNYSILLEICTNHLKVVAYNLDLHIISTVHKILHALHRHSSNCPVLILELKRLRNILTIKKELVPNL